MADGRIDVSAGPRDGALVKFDARDGRNATSGGRAAGTVPVSVMERVMLLEHLVPRDGGALYEVLYARADRENGQK